MDEQTHTDDVDFEPEEELGSITAAKQKIAKLRDELERVKKERQEYLDGWQRCKADSVNARRDGLQAIEQASARSAERVIEEILPIIDSFDLAMHGDSWHAIDANWRVGVESIAKQLLGALEGSGAIYFGSVGDAYDPALHEVLQETEGGESNTVAHVVRRGWRCNGHILRPAHVILYK